MDIDETQVFIFLKSVNRRVHSRKELMKYIDESKIYCFKVYWLLIVVVRESSK